MMVPTTTKTTTTTTTTTMTTMTTTRTTTTATTTRTRTRTRTRRRRRTRSNNNNDDNNDNDDNDDDDNEDAARSMSCPQVQMKSPSFPPPTPTGIAGVRSSTILPGRKKTSRKCSNLLSEAKSSKLAKLLMINGKSHAARASHGHLPASTSKASEPSAELPGAACVSRGFRRPNCHLLFTLW